MRDLMWLSFAGLVTVFLAWGGLSASPEWSRLDVADLPAPTAEAPVVVEAEPADAAEVGTDARGDPPVWVAMN